MDLDRHSIVVRPRSYVEILDLALGVLRVHGGRLLLAFLPGVILAMAVNAWLVGQLFEPGADPGSTAGYMWWMLLLVLWEAPLVTAPATLYLGQALFQQQARPREIAANLLGSLPQMLWYQVFLRGLLLLLPLTWFRPFAARPFAGEVILLERNPLRKRGNGRMTSRRRMAMLHAGAGGDLFGHWITAAVCGSLLVGSLWGSLAFLGNTLLNSSEAEGPLFMLYYPARLVDRRRLLQRGAVPRLSRPAASAAKVGRWNC